MTTGIYCIENTIDNWRYVGLAKGVESRLRDHIRGLRKGKHFNDNLQASFNLHGESAFKFHILEECSIETLRVNEQKWIDKFKPNVYNTVQPASRVEIVNDKEKAKANIEFLYAINYNDPIPSGIFMLLDVIANRGLIQAGNDMTLEVELSLNALEYGLHPNRNLQFHWDVISPSRWTIIVLERITNIDKLSERLDVWIHRMKKGQNLFNISSVSHLVSSPT